MAQGQPFDPFGDPVLSKYLTSVLEWHGYIRFLGLPHLRENPDVTIDRLYVEPNIADRWLSPDPSPADWPATVPAVEAFITHQRLVVLGDPGSGKSTLVNWLACQLALKSPGPVVQGIGRLLPLPMVVRELPVTRDTSWDSLVDAFLQRPVSRPLGDRTRVDDLLEQGRVLVILDGLDELGNVELRARLRAAVLDGMTRYPGCRYVLTSRIVGYDEVPFHTRESLGGRLPEQVELREAETSGLAEVRFVAPFNDEQIQRFAVNWFAQREAFAEQAQVGARAFVEAVSRDRATLRLARTPNLLTMMALIFRIRARLPHGRTLLYDEITEAYLQSIDEFRKLATGTEYPGVQKRRWLSRVGFEMQLRRSAQAPAGEGEPREVLVDEADVRRWVAHAMTESGYGRDEVAAGEFVDYIARRSGLLLPRGEGKFAFMHLSFQEYFAARFLEEQVTSPLWLITEDAPPGASRSALTEHVQKTTWRETFVFLFELLADRPGWPQALANVLFGKDFKALGSDAGPAAAAALLAQLTVNPHSGFTTAMRATACDACWQWEVSQQRSVEVSEHPPVVARILFSAEMHQITSIWTSLIEAARQTDRLTVRGAAVADLRELAKLTGLQSLDVSGTLASDLEPLTALQGLQELWLDGVKAMDIRPLAKLPRLRWISLDHTPVNDVEPLGALPELTTLHLARTRIDDLRPLARGFEQLETLDLWGTAVSDLRPLSHLTHLRVLWVGGTKVTTLVPLARMSRLRVLAASYTRVENLTPVSRLVELDWLMLSGTRVKDLRPLAGLSKLRTLFLDGTEVTDVSPLFGLNHLRELHVTGTPVTDFGPLVDRPGLKIFR